MTEKTRCFFIKGVLSGFCLAILLSLPLHAQKSSVIKRYWHRVIHEQEDISKPQFITYPTLAYSPETSWELGFYSLYVFYAKRDTANRLSEVNAFTFITLENQYGIWLEHALYSDQNKWFFLGKIRFQSFPLLYHGIGPQSPSGHIARIDANQIMIKERVLRKIYGNFYAGLEFDFQRLSSVSLINTTQQETAPPRGIEGSSNPGLGLGVLYDNRHNVLNVRNGFFSELAFLRYSPLWKSDYNFTYLISDTRIYKPINKRDVLAAQVLGQFNFGDTPFNQLALIGGESMMRGYYLGRYRDRKLMAAQVEYRFLPLPLGFSKRIGASLFAASAAIADNFEDVSFNHLKWSGGGGLRFLLFPKKDIFTRLDVAFTNEGTGFYLYIGEAF